ncbi:MAG: HEAT repeat domain-containing protein, partial [Candidatus Eremiobacterota bacterium]
IVEPVECMIEVLEENVEELVYPAVSFLESLKGERVVNILIDNYDRTSPETKYWIVYLLGLTGHSKAFPLLKKALEHETVEIRWEAAQAMGSMGNKAFLSLIKALSDPDPVVRSSSVMTLGRLGIYKSVKYIKKAMKDEDFTVRFWAGLALKELEESES